MTKRQRARRFATAIRALGVAAVLVAPLAARAATSAPAVFAIVVTNNRSTRLDRPDLQYADDDGARYYQLFRGVAPAAQLRLLTRFDRATASVHPELAAVTQPPRRAELVAALADVRAAVIEARRAGQRTEFYFVFAGHGDVQGGVGYLDLEDARIDPTFLEHEVVDRVPADVLHVVLDSCNSFFVVNPRKPGGRRWATPRDLALGFAARHPNVGLFLSTNSEGEVYEWSEFESGIFSHEVRSGLSGAADADGDGRVSYAELAGFVDRANAKLPQSNLRPQVFQRGPNGDAGAALFSPAHAEGRRLLIGSGERRLWIRATGNERLLDLHKEEAPMTIVVPGEAAQPLTVVEWHAAKGPADRPVLAEYDLPPGTAPVALAERDARASEGTARGGGAIFGDLFKVPYGPQAFTSFLAENARADEPVFGIGSADEARMRHYLTFIAESDARSRTTRAWSWAAWAPSSWPRAWRRLPRPHAGTILAPARWSSAGWACRCWRSGSTWRSRKPAVSARSRPSSPSWRARAWIAPRWSPTSNRTWTISRASSDVRRTSWPGTSGRWPWLVGAATGVRAAQGGDWSPTGGDGRRFRQRRTERHRRLAHARERDADRAALEALPRGSGSRAAPERRADGAGRRQQHRRDGLGFWPLLSWPFPKREDRHASECGG